MSRNNMTHNYKIKRDGRYYSAINMDTQQVEYGGINNTGGINGKNRKAVVQKAIDMVEKPAVIYLWYISWYELKNEGITKPSDVGIIQYSLEIGEIEHNSDLRHDHKKTDIPDFFGIPFWELIPDKPSTYTPSTHTHTESEITDLIHDAQKIKGKEVDDSQIGDNKFLKYNASSGKIEYVSGGTGGMEVHGNEYHDPDFSVVGHGHYRDTITDFFSSPFWANIPDKPSVFLPSEHGNEAHNPEFLTEEIDPTVDSSLKGVTKEQVQDHTPKIHSHPESEVTNLITDLAAKETPSGSQAKVDAHKDLTTGVHGVGTGTIAKISDIADDTKLSTNAQDAVSKRHSHSNQTLLDSYTQTEVNLADAVSKRHSNSLDHSHSNKTLLDSYAQTEVNLSDAVTKKHSHSNQTLLDSYTQTEANLADAVTKKHSHSNQTLLDSYTQTEANLADVVSKKHTQIHGSADHTGTIGTPTQVGLANVTNDSQLKRADGDINSFTVKTTPVGEDILLIEDSAASFAKRKITIATLPTGGSGGTIDENIRKIGTTQYESWYTPICSTTALTTGALTANRFYAFPFIVPKTMTLDRIAINVTTAGTGNARLGIYTSSVSLGLYPDQKVIDAGEVSIASTGIKSITISQQLTAEMYWLVLVSNGTPTIRCHALIGIMPLLGYTSSLGAEIAAVGLYVSFTYAALPTTFPTTTTTKITAVPIPAIFVRVSA